MSSEKSPPPLDPGLNAKLSTMMFLQYAIWGAWLTILYPFLMGYREMPLSDVGWIFAIGAVGAIVAPFVAGQIADRYFNTEKYLGISHILGGILIWQLASISTFWGFFWFSLAYSIIYSPTISLTNSLSFHHIPDRDRDFGRVRVWGTVGWIAAGIVVGHWLLASWTPDKEEPAKGITVAQIYSDPATNVPEAIKRNSKHLKGVLKEGMIQKAKEKTVSEYLKNAGKKIPQQPKRDNNGKILKGNDGKELEEIDYPKAVEALNMDSDKLARAEQATLSKDIVTGAQNKGRADAFRLSALLGILMGIFCFFLPKTPPAKSEQKSAALAALGEVKRQPLITLFLLAVPISCIHQFYFVFASDFLTQFQAGAAGFVETVNRIFGVGGGGLMTIGQMCEIAVLAAMPFAVKRLSRKTLLATGIVAYGLRMFLFAHVNSFPEGLHLPIVIIGAALHGFCFGCFIFVAYMVVDEETTDDIRASAQSLFNVVIIGVGIIVGSKISTGIGALALEDGVMNYPKLFSYPMWAAAICLVLLLAFYPGRKSAVAEGDQEPQNEEETEAD
jgi:MFS family permease